MAKVGLSKPYYAIYNAAGGVVTYSNGGLMGKATELSASIETAEDNNLYADNGIAESDRSFASGTLSVGTDDLEQAASAALLGITAKSVTVGEATVSELVFDDDVAAPDLGVGIIIKKIVAGVTKWRAIVFTKVKFGIPEDAATTQGENIEWQTPAIEGTIMRDDTAKHAWKREATVESEALAEAYIKQVLNITGGGT